MDKNIEKYFLESSKFIYTRLQLLNWVCQGLYQSTTLHQKTVNYISDIYKKFKNEKILVLDCLRVDTIGSNSLNQFFENDISERVLILINCISINSFITSKLNGYELQYQKNGDSIIISKSDINIEKMNFDEISKSLVHDFIEKIVTKSFIPNVNNELKRLHSTPILSNGEFDASLIITNPLYFSWICIKLSDLVESYIKDLRSREDVSENKYNDEKILSVSLRSSSFAISVASLINKEYIIVDHFGPKFKLYDLEVIDYFNKETLIIYIGDFLIGGTEAMIAQTYSSLFDSDLKNVTTIGSIFSKEEAKECFKGKFHFESLVNLRNLKVKTVTNATYKLFNE